MVALRPVGRLVRKDGLGDMLGPPSCGLLFWCVCGPHHREIRQLIAPALGTGRTDALLATMAASRFVTTVDIAVKLVTLTSLIRAGGSLIMSGPTGTGE